MKKQTLNEEFKRMQKLAGLITENNNYPNDELPYELGEPHPSAVYPAGGAWHTLSTGTSIDIGEDPYHGQYPMLTIEEHEEVIELLNNYIEQYEENFGGTEYYNKDVVDLAKYIVQQHEKKISSLMMNENLEEGWKTWALGGLMSLATLAGIGKAYVPNIDSLSSKQKTELSQNAYRDALKNMSKEDVDTLWSQVNKSNIKDNLKQNQFSITSDTDKETVDAAWPDMQRAELETAISKNLDRFVIDSTGTVIFISNPTGFTAIKEENISRISKSDFKNMIREMVLAEAKKDEKEEEEDVEIEDTETVDTEEMPTEETPQGNPDDILDSLKTALDGAKALGDEKLVDQIGNTITFYTRVHIVGQETDMN